MSTAVAKVKEEEQQFFQMVASNLGVKYGVELMVERVRSQIHVANSKQVVTNEDVAQVLTEAMAKHLDPLKGGLYAFKGKDDRLIIGTTKRGFQQALYSQPTFRDLKFIPRGELKAKRVTSNSSGQSRNITYYDAVTCVITKVFPDKTVGTVEGTAYFDEEFNDANMAWMKSPKRMLEGRALCIASANAYGWGAYDPEEAGRVMGVNVEVAPETGDVLHVDVEDVPTPVQQVESKPTGASRAQQALAKAQAEIPVEVQEVAQAVEMTATNPRAELIKQIQACKNREELEGTFRSAPQDLKHDPEIINLFKAVASGL